MFSTKISFLVLKTLVRAVVESRASETTSNAGEKMHSCFKSELYSGTQREKKESQ